MKSSFSEKTKLMESSIYSQAQQFLCKSNSYKQPPNTPLDERIRLFCNLVHCSLNRIVQEISKYPTEETDDDFISKYSEFTIGKFLGRGQAGTVLLGEDCTGKPLFAIKVIHLPNAVGVGLPIRRTFLCYQKVLKCLDNPFIIKYLGWTLVENEAHVYTEYCDGGSLYSMIYKNNGLSDLNQIKRILSEILNGLMYLHSHCIIHRDLKPGNILMKNGNWKITDFGSARIQQPCCMDSHQKKLSGTAAYCPPCSIKGDFVYEHCAEDIWSLGCVLYEMVMAKSPWHECDNAFAIYFTLGNLRKDEPVPLIKDVIEKGVLDQCGIDFLTACLQIDPRDRPSSFQLLEMGFCYKL